MAFVEFDDILKECDEQIAELRWDNKQLFSSEGENAVQYAIQNGAYKNRTGVLRKSNCSEVIEDENISLDIENTAPYGSFVEAKGYDVLSGAFLETKKRVETQFE